MNKSSLILLLLVQCSFVMGQAKYYNEVPKTEAFPTAVKAPKDAPNVVVIMLDDVGFGQPSVNGGLINTPNLEKLAKQGLYYNRFHTNGVCSPSRASLMTGRNAHQSGNGMIMELSSGFPGYNSMWGDNIASMAEVLKDNGYNTSMFGKWHNTPDWESSPVGPFTRWPMGKGFENFYGFIGGESSQWQPQLFANNSPVEAPQTPEQGYHLTRDLVDHTINWIHQHKSLDPNKPFFAYLATGAVHAPLHVPDTYIKKYKGKFDIGWDKMREIVFERQKAMGVVAANTQLTPRPAVLPAWDTLSVNAKKLYAHQMEVFAAFLEHTDYEIGRLLDDIEQSPYADNTIIIYIVGDNGASPEGGMTGTTNNMMTQNGFNEPVENQLSTINELGSEKHENHYAVPWSWAGNTPFQWMKRTASHLGATRNSMIVKWTKGITTKNEKRNQFEHLIDIYPTILEAANIPFPEEFHGVKQVPLAGKSLMSTFNDKNAPETHITQYFETEGNRSIYHDGWMASAFHALPWNFLNRKGDFENDKWELYNLNEDFSQSNNLAEKNPEKLKELQALFDQEAFKYNVYPIDDRWLGRGISPLMPSLRRKKSFEYTTATTRLPEGSSPPIYAKNHTITAELSITQNNPNGVLVACGGTPGGYSLYVKNGKLVYDYNFFDKNHYVVTSNIVLPKGNVEVKMQYTQTGKNWGEGGNAKLFINGKQVGESDISKVVPGRFNATETFDIGMDLGSTVSNAYNTLRPFKFTDTIKNVKVELN